MRLLPILAALTVATPALAQTAPPPPAASDYETAIAQQVSEEHWAFLKANANVKMLSAQVETLSKQVAKLNGELAEAKKGAAKTPEPVKKE